MNRVLVLTADDYFGNTGQPLTLKDQVLADFAAKANKPVQPRKKAKITLEILCTCLLYTSRCV